MRILAFVLAAASAFAAEIPAGSHVLLRLQNTVNTRSAQPADYLYFTTTVPISSNNKVVVPAGSFVQGVVLNTDRGGRIKGRAELGIKLETLTLPTGEQYKIQPRVASTEGGPTTQKVIDQEGTIQQGSSVETDVANAARYGGQAASTGVMLGGITSIGSSSAGTTIAKGGGIGAGIGAGVGLAVALATRGKDVEIRQGTTVDIVFDRPVEIQ